MANTKLAGELVPEPPAYADSLDTFHQAFENELADLITDLPLRPGQRVLDVPCGDGYFAHLMAHEVGPSGEVVGVDCSAELLARAGLGPRWVEADAYALPFADGSFDGALCARSLISLPKALPALKEIRRVVRPGGFVALAEEDSLHNAILPWPPELELGIQSALRRAGRQRYGSAGKLYQGRRLNHLLRAAGIQPVRKKTYAWDQQAPLSARVREFWEDYLRTLAEQLDGTLAEPEAHLFRELTTPGSGLFLLDRPDLEVTYLNMLAIGRRD